MIGALVSLLALAAPLPGQPAPDFSEASAQGDVVSLATVAGRTLVLEWTDHGCPFVEKHYVSGHMQALQKRAAAEGVTWIQVVSSPAEDASHADAHEVLAANSERGARPAFTLLDTDGSMARAYGARTAPHMFVIDAGGILRYSGAIDTIASADPEDLRYAQNYVEAALRQVLAGGEVVTTTTKPYGCPVTYADG